MAAVDNLSGGGNDPFGNNGGDAEAQEQSAITSRKKTNEIHIRVQQRNGRKCITTLQGLHKDLDFDRLAKEFKRRWGCNGIVVDGGKDAGMVIQLQGDQRQHLTEFLTSEKLAKLENIKTFGGT